VDEVLMASGAKLTSQQRLHNRVQDVQRLELERIGHGILENCMLTAEGDGDAGRTRSPSKYVNDDKI
jgi:hypothetical protein